MVESLGKGLSHPPGSIACELNQLGYAICDLDGTTLQVRYLSKVFVQHSYNSEEVFGVDWDVLSAQPLDADALASLAVSTDEFAKIAVEVEGAKAQEVQRMLAGETGYTILLHRKKNGIFVPIALVLRLYVDATLKRCCVGIHMDLSVRISARDLAQAILRGEREALCRKYQSLIEHVTTVLDREDAPAYFHDQLTEAPGIHEQLAAVSSTPRCEDQLFRSRDNEGSVSSEGGVPPTPDWSSGAEMSEDENLHEADSNYSSGSGKPRGLSARRIRNQRVVSRRPRSMTEELSSVCTQIGEAGEEEFDLLVTKTRSCRVGAVSHRRVERRRSLTEEAPILEPGHRSVGGTGDGSSESPRKRGKPPSPASSTSSLLSRRRGLKSLTLDMKGYKKAEQQKMSHRDILAAEGYILGGVMGCSSNHGFVVITAHKGRQRFAVKCTEERRGEGTLADVLRSEFEILRRLRHPNIVGALRLAEAELGSASVMEFCPGKQLLEVLPFEAPLTTMLRQSILDQILTAVEYIHAHGVAHRDLHTENIIVDVRNESILVDEAQRDGGSEPYVIVKVIDFGSARFSSVGMKDGPLIIFDDVDARILPPSFVAGDDDMFSCDMFAVGLLAVGLMIGRSVFTEDVTVTLASGTAGAKLDAPQVLPLASAEGYGRTNRADQFLHALLTLNAQARVRAEAARKALPAASEWFQCSLTSDPLGSSPLESCPDGLGKLDALPPNCGDFLRAIARGLGCPSWTSQVQRPARAS